MALTDPYTIDEAAQEVRGTHPSPMDLDDVNSALPFGPTVEEIRECDCVRPVGEADIERGDKWHLRLCADCHGLYSWHDARGDYL